MREASMGNEEQHNREEVGHPTKKYLNVILMGEGEGFN
jgi:hypothetical protein